MATITFTQPSLDQWEQSRFDAVHDPNTGFAVPTTFENDVPATIGKTINWSGTTDADYKFGGTVKDAEIAGSISDVLPYLRVSNFGFSLPSTATLVGMEVRVINSSDADVNDYTEDDLHVSWGASAANLSTTNKWTGAAGVSAADNTYGGAADMWGETAVTLTPTVVNSSDFGICLRVDRFQGSGTGYRVRALQMKVHYTITDDSNVRVSTTYVEVIGSSGAASGGPVQQPGKVIVVT